MGSIPLLSSIGTFCLALALVGALLVVLPLFLLALDGLFCRARHLVLRWRQIA